ncbi:MAG: hypothetical protein HYS74_01950 [Parcubacteria group bacterium]|nr:hypothetical protein [Parcubacteria group bacterium]
MERKFLVLLRRFRLQNEHLYYIHLRFFDDVHFSVLTATEALPLGVLW